MVDEESDTSPVIDQPEAGGAASVDAEETADETGSGRDWRHPSLDAIVLLLLVAVGLIGIDDQ